MQVKKILYPTDFSRCSEQALSQALFLAEHFDAELLMLHVVVLHADDPANPEQRFPEGKVLLDKLLEIAGSELSTLAERGARSLKVREIKERGISPGGVILEQIRDHDVDLVVMGTHGRRRGSRLLFGSVAEEVVRFAPCPVLTLRELDEPRGVAAVKRLLVPVDFSPPSELALAYARHLARLYGATLQLLHVIEQPVWPNFYSPFAGLSAADEIAQLERRAHTALAELAAQARGPAVSYELFLERGRPSDRIVEHAARHEADMIVMASHGLTGLEHLLLGSTAQEVVRSSRSPVFLVKPFAKSLLVASA